MPNIFVTWENISFIYSVPQSVRNRFTGTKIREWLSTRARATVAASFDGTGTVIRNLLKLHIIVTAYLFPVSVILMCPIVSNTQYNDGILSVGKYCLGCLNH